MAGAFLIWSALTVIHRALPYDQSGVQDMFLIQFNYDTRCIMTLINVPNITWKRIVGKYFSLEQG